MVKNGKIFENDVTEDDLGMFKGVHEKGIRKSFEEDFHGPSLIGAGKPEQFRYCAFVTNLYAIDLLLYLNALTAMEDEDADVAKCTEVFNMTINRAVSVAKKIIYTASNHKPGVIDKDTIIAQKNCIADMLHVADALIPMMNILVSRGHYIDHSLELLETIQEYYTSYEALTAPDDTTAT